MLPSILLNYSVCPLHVTNAIQVKTNLWQTFYPDNDLMAFRYPIRTHISLCQSQIIVYKLYLYYTDIFIGQSL